MNYMRNKRLLLFDGNALIHRAYHAMPPLTVKKSGENVGAVYGFMSMFIKTVGAYLPEYIAFTFDKKGPIFRKELYSDYKANRPKAPDDLISQIILVHEVVNRSGIAFFEADGFEADDMIGTIAKAAKEQGIYTLIVTGDADAMQLVDDQTAVLYPAKGNSFSELKEFSVTDVKDKYGVYPHHIADLKALSGDSSDNIPGVNGIGPKTASSLIEKYGSVENICQNVTSIDSKRARELLSDACEDIVLFKKLCQINTDVPVNFDFDDMRTVNISIESLRQLFKELDFHSLVPRLEALEQLYQSADTQILSTNKSQNHNYTLVQTLQDLNNLASLLKETSAFALTVLADNQNAQNARLLGLSLAVDQKQSYYIHMPKGNPQLNSQISMFDGTLTNDGSLSFEQIRQILNPIFENAQMYAHNAKHNLHLLKQNGFSMPYCCFDTMLAAYVLGEQNVGLQSLALGRFGHNMAQISQVLGKGQKSLSISELDAGTVCSYSCADADYIYRLKDVLALEIEEENLGHLYYNMELPLMPVLFDMEQAGILLDECLFVDMGRKYDNEISRLTQEIFSMTGRSFNISSPQQMAAILYDDLKLPVIKQTATGRSTDAGTLEEIASTHNVIPLILQYRALTKIKSTYIDALPKLVSAVDGRLHTMFNQTGTSTGRLSSSDPNLQNIPVREERGIKEIRNAFKAPNGSLLLSADYSQIDLRVLAHLSEDATLIQSFLSNDDIHAATAARLFEVSINEVSSTQRRLAKTVNFGVMYGMSSFGLERATKLSRIEASQFIKTYFEKYPAVSAYFAKVKEEARQKGFVQTLFGRRRYIADINSRQFNVREAAERMAINMPVQGTSSDIIKIAMINIHKALKEGGYKSQMLLQVHDELIFECPERELEVVLDLVKKHMSEAVSLKVPLLVEARIGSNWGEMKHV